MRIIKQGVGLGWWWRWYNTLCVFITRYVGVIGILSCKNGKITY